MAEVSALSPLDRATEEQCKAADPQSSVVVTANAGSGKTKVLIDRVARLLLGRGGESAGADPASILCITYTRAAANEMLTRLFDTLGAWAVMEDEPLKARLAKLEERHPGTYTIAELRAARALFARALETPGGLRIETIHAFCARVLRRFPLEAGVFPGFRELEDSDARKLWDAACRKALFESADHWPDDLSRVARVSGGRGASDALESLRKCSGIVTRFARTHNNSFDKIEAALRESLQPPDRPSAQLLGDAFGPEMRRDALEDVYNAIARTGAGNTSLLGLLRETLDETDPATAWTSYKRLILTSAGTPRTQSWYSKEVARAVPEVVTLFALSEPPGTEVSRLRRLADELERAEAFERTLSLLRVGLPALAAYQSRKEALGVLDFDDLIGKTKDLLQSEGLSSWVLFKLDGGLTHLLLDEAQDTSPDQWQLIQALTAEFRAGDGAERDQNLRTLFIVGDEKQSIYSFQGADPDAFVDILRNLTQAQPPARRAELLASFRSSPEILSFVDAVWNNSTIIETAESRIPPRTADRTKHLATRAAEPGSVELWPVVEKNPDEEADAWQRPVDSISEASPKAQLADRIAASLADMISQGETIWDGKGRQRAVEPRDILILVRDRQGGLFEAMIHALKRRGLPVAGADRLILTDHIAVRDCLNLIRFALLPARDLTLAEILRGPFVGLVDDDMYLYPLAAGRAQGETLWSRVQNSQDPEVQCAFKFLDKLLASRDLPPYEYLMAALAGQNETGLTGWQRLNARLGEPARDPVEALLTRAIAHDAAGPSSLQLFLNSIESEPIEIKRDLDEAGRAIRIMTVHGAKGLQAPIVILPDTTRKPKTTASAILQVSDSIIWSPRKALDTPAAEVARAIAETKALEEHRRLLYVALTRAQDRLIITGAWHGRDDEKNPGYDAQSWYADCRQGMEALGVGPSGGVWRYGAAAAASTMKGDEPETASEFPAWLTEPPSAEAQGARMMAPSRLLPTRALMLAPFDAGREIRLRRGRLIHTLLQYLPDIPDDQREPNGRAYLARQEGITDSEISEMLTAALGVLRAPDFAHLFGPGGRAEAEIIGSSPELPANTIIQGRVDRLIVESDRVLILDYKTDQPAPASVDQVAASYIAQMAAYWAVLRHLYPGRRAEAALCWTDGPILMPLPEDLLLGSLAQLSGDV